MYGSSTVSAAISALRITRPPLLSLGTLKAGGLPDLARARPRERSDEGCGGCGRVRAGRHRGGIGRVVGERRGQLADHPRAPDWHDLGNECDAELGLAARNAFRHRRAALLRLGLALDLLG